MAKKADTVYDPAALQMTNIAGLNKYNLEIKDYATPAGVTMLLQAHEITLTELQSSKAASDVLFSKVENLTESNTDLRVRLALSEQRQKILWLEIPIMIIIGIATNMVTQTPPQSLGWVILVMGVSALVYLRFADLAHAALKTTRGNTNGD